jgi:hypothetical protein
MPISVLKTLWGAAKAVVLGPTGAAEESIEIGNSIAEQEAANVSKTIEEDANKKVDS